MSMSLDTVYMYWQTGTRFLAGCFVQSFYISRASGAVSQCSYACCEVTRRGVSSVSGVGPPSAIFCRWFKLLNWFSCHFCMYIPRETENAVPDNNDAIAHPIVLDLVLLAGSIVEQFRKFQFDGGSNLIARHADNAD